MGIHDIFMLSVKQLVNRKKKIIIRISLGCHIYMKLACSSAVIRENEYKLTLIFKQDQGDHCRSLVFRF